MQLAEFIERNRDRLVSRWKQLAVERLALRMEHSALLNHLPEFIEDLIQALLDPEQLWPNSDGARSHGEHRLQHGLDIGSLTEEMILIAEVVCDLADEDDLPLAGAQMRALNRALGRGAAVSLHTYTTMRDRELAEQAARHFSFIAHEIRNPLHNARLAAALIARGGDHDRAKHVARLERSLGQLSELVDNSLVGARFYTEPELQLHEIDAQDLVSGACDDIAGTAEVRGLKISSKVEPFELQGDQRLLSSALVNLLKNAAKFTRERTTLRVRASAQGDRALFEVEDECGGIAEEQLPRLFLPFVQANADRSGFGLGLRIVQQVAHAHGGAVRVVNHPGRGCAFVLDVPLVQRVASEADAQAAGARDAAQGADDL